MLWQWFARKEVAAGWCLQWIVVTAGWSHHHPAKPRLAACWFSLISDGIFHQAELMSVRRQEHLLLCPSWVQSLPAQQCLRKSKEPHGNNYHSVLVGQWLCLQCLRFAGSEMVLQDLYLVLVSSMPHAVLRQTLERQTIFSSNISGGKTLFFEKKRRCGK